MSSLPKLTIPPIGQLLLAAVLIAAVAFLTTFQSQYAGAVTAALVMAAFIAGVVAFVAAYQGQPGTPVPWNSLAVAIVTAIATVALWAAHQSGPWTTMTVIAGVILFLTMLEQEVAGWTPTASTRA
jgi:peptidoglycan/LPS O-acetylase OafA/YrhL